MPFMMSHFLAVPTYLKPLICIKTAVCKFCAGFLETPIHCSIPSLHAGLAKGPLKLLHLQTVIRSCYTFDLGKAILCKIHSHWPISLKLSVRRHTGPPWCHPGRTQNPQSSSHSPTTIFKWQPAHYSLCDTPLFTVKLNLPGKFLDSGVCPASDCT